MPAGGFVDAGGVGFVGGLGQDEAAVAVAALGDARLAQFEPHARMTQRPADAVTGHAMGADGDDFRLRGGIGHGDVAFRSVRA